MHSLFSKYLSDPESERLCSEFAFLKQMSEVEIALSLVQAQMGIIPQAAADEIKTKLPYVPWDLNALANSTAINGIPVIGFLEQAKKELSAEHADYLHWGVTSQDITDTAIILLLKEIFIVFETRLRNIINNLRSLEVEYGDFPILARTRNQQAIPIRFGQKLQNWRLPLERQLERINEIRPRLLKIQMGGAGGNLEPLKNKAETMVQLLAKTLGLVYAPAWHSQRDAIVEAGDLMANISSSLGKMGTDLLVLTQSEVAEVEETGNAGGTSSSMPHKSNPVLSEALVALAEYSIGLSGILKRAQLHKNERDGVGLSLEWITLPLLICATGASLNHALAISKKMRVFPDRMKEKIEQSMGLVFSEKAVYILSEHFGRAQAKSILKQASKMVLEQNIPLVEVLRDLCPELGVDWEKELSI